MWGRRPEKSASARSTDFRRRSCIHRVRGRTCYWQTLGAPRGSSEEDRYGREISPGWRAIPAVNRKNGFSFAAGSGRFAIQSPHGRQTRNLGLDGIEVRLGEAGMPPG